MICTRSRSYWSGSTTFLYLTAQVQLSGAPGNTMALSPDERWLAVGDPVNDAVSIFSVDPSTGAMGNAVAATGSVGSVGNGGMAFNPNGKQILVSSAGGAGSSVRVYSFDTITGNIGQDPAREFNTHANPSRITVADLNNDGIVSRISISCHSV